MQTESNLRDRAIEALKADLKAGITPVFNVPNPKPGRVPDMAYIAIRHYMGVLRS